MPENTIDELIKKNPIAFDAERKNTVIILAAGHGKRIKSNTSKMLHEIWGKPSVLRVIEASQRTFGEDANLIVVVGVKAPDVISSLSKSVKASYAYQSKQNGTGHAVQVALEKIPTENYSGNIYVLPGDMGLIDYESLDDFRAAFEKSDNDMMVLTGIYEGDISENSYGRIIRVPVKDTNGNPSGHDLGKVIEIIEYKDIRNLKDDDSYIAEYKGKKYAFGKSELIANNEYNSGVFAYKYDHLKKHISALDNNNVQQEIYLTDLIALFNKNGLKVGAISPKYQHVIMGFNNKSVLMEMNSIARELIHKKIKDIVTIKDPDDFFISEDLVEDLIRRDAEGEILDITLERGVFLGHGTKLGTNILFGKDVKLTGEVTVGDNCIIDDFSVIEGKVSIENNSRIKKFSVITK